MPISSFRMQFIWLLTFVAFGCTLAARPETITTTVVNTGPSLYPEAHDEQARIAGTTLLELASKDSDYGRRVLTPVEHSMIYQCFKLGGDHPLFTDRYKEAIRATVVSNNINVLQFLFSAYPSEHLLANDSDILQLALKTYANDCRWGNYRQRALDVVLLLMTYGPPLDGVDEDGNTALYYACRYGFPDAFKELVDAGADYYTRHLRQVEGINGDGESETTTPTNEKITLLQVAADALHNTCHDRTTGYARRLPRGHREWMPIITFLMDDDFVLPLDEPATATVIEYVCSEGTEREIDLVLRKGIESVAGRGVVGSRASALTPALHVAVSEDRTDVVEMLLRKGADPGDKLVYVTFSRSSVERTAVAQACVSSEYSASLDACELLLDAGIDMEDRRLLLKASIKFGRLELIKRLMESGVMVDEAPLCPSLEILQYLHDKNVSIDPVKSQEHALALGSTEMLRWLVVMHGPQLPDVRALYRSPADDAMYGDQSHVTDYLVSEYGHNVAGSQDIHAKISRDVLSYAAWPQNHELLKKLLQRGQDVQCPGAKKGAYDVLKSILREGRRLEDGISKEHILILQTLLSFGSEDADFAGRDSNQVWLTPELLPRDLFEALGAEKGPHVYFSWTPREASQSSSVPLSVDQATETRKRADTAQPTASTSVATANALGHDGDDDHTKETDGQRRIYQYTKLRALYNIRLLLLEPTDSPDAPITGQLIESSLLDKLRYETVSYVREDCDNFTDILVDDMPHSIPQSLHSALTKLRKGNETRSLWVDAVSVNQMDAEECTQQAGIKKQTLQSASNAMIWLGEEADNSHLVFDHIKEWTIYRDDILSGRRTHDENDMIRDDHINPPHYEGKTREALQQLAMRQWFFDVRVIQDLVLSPKAYLICGDHVQDFELIVLPMSFRMGSAYDPLRGIDGPTHLHNLDSLGRTEGTHDVKRLLNYATLCDSADPKDKVFALLDLFAQPPIAVDYNMTVEEVYQRFTQALLERLNDIQLLHWLGTKRTIESLPSWVPDFSITKPVGVLPRVESFRHISNEVSRLLEHALPGMRFEGENMIIRGIQIDKITAISDEMVGDPAHAPGQPGFLNILSKWEHRATQLQSKQFREPITHAFLKTISASDPYSLHDDAPTGWYDRYGSGILRQFDQQAFVETDFLLSWRGGEYQMDREEMFISHFNIALESAVYGRSFFLTEQESMGLAPPRAEAGDVVVYFPGGLYPFVLREKDTGVYEMVGDCYLYGFDELSLKVEEIQRFGEFVLV